MHGSLAQNPLPRLIKTLHREKETGVLALFREETSKRIYFGEGSMVFARSDLHTDRLGEFLVQQGRMTRTQLADASNKMRATGRMLGTTLVSMGILSEHEMKARVAEQVRSIIYSLFTWPEGEHEFASGAAVSSDMAVELPTVPIILEGVRHVTDPETVRRGLGEFQRVVSYSRDPIVHSHHVSLTPREGFVLSRVDGQLTLADIVAITPLPEDETLHCLYNLISAGFLEFGAKSREISPKQPRRTPIESFHPSSVRREEPRASGQARTPVLTAEERRQRNEILLKHASLDRGSYYQLLGVQRTASEEDLRKAYSELVKKYHPDRNASPLFDDLKGELGAILAKLMEAYEALSDPTTRRRYDNSLRTEAPRGESESGSAPAAVAPPQSPSLAETIARRYYDEASRSFRKGDWHRTVKLMEEAVEIDPKAAYHRLLAKALVKNPKWRKAAEENFKRALALEPFDAESYLGLAELYREVGMTRREKNMLARARELDPGAMFH